MMLNLKSKIRAGAVALAISLTFMVGAARADTLVESYQAVLSERDHFNSNGERLTEAAAIVRQDRANYHKFGKRDQGDQNDSFFADKANRDLLEKLLKRGKSGKAALNSIVNGTPTILVEIYTDDDNNDYVTVTIYD